jgi:hypothetical protein
VDQEGEAMNGETPRGATKPHRDGLGARYVAVRYSAMYYERAAARWRRWCLLGWSWGTVATVLAIWMAVWR